MNIKIHTDLHPDIQIKPVPSRKLSAASTKPAQKQTLKLALALTITMGLLGSSLGWAADPSLNTTTTTVTTQQETRQTEQPTQQSAQVQAPQGQSQLNEPPQPAEASNSNKGWDSGKNHIERVLDAQLMKGYPDGHFHPEGELTRAQLAHILVKTFKLNTRQPQSLDTSQMSDVPPNYWAYDDIKTVLQDNVMQGYRPGQFYPNQRVTRAEAFAIFAQAYGVFQFKPDMVEGMLDKYKDANQIPGWATKAMATAVHEGFVNTDELSDRLYPDKPMTRGDMAYALSKYLERVYNPNLPVYKK